MKEILITGGAGYIGSHVLRLIAKKKIYKITVIDNLERGFKEAIDVVSSESANSIKFIKMDLRNQKEFQKLNAKNFDAVLHFAAFLSINESVEDPLRYFENNVGGSINLLKYMRETQSQNLVFSSTSALYSRKAKIPFTEKSDIAPENPYAESKLMIEKIINWSSQTFKIRPLILRYFNPCGCSLDAKIGYSLIPAIQLMPAAVRGALELQDFKVTCGKVDTPDGTTIRDYFNVLDLADAHEVALEALLRGHKGGTFNVGIGKGHSVLEIINLVKKVTGIQFKVEPGKPRKGELPIVYCTPSKFQKEFNWNPKYTLEQVVESLFKWFKEKPEGYSY